MMGVYTLVAGEECDGGAPVYTKGGDFLYRNTYHRWSVGATKCGSSAGLNSVEAGSASPVGLTWKYGDGDGWHLDADIACAGMRGSAYEG